MIGTTRIELTDVDSGEKKVYEKQNMVTNGIAELMRPRLNPSFNFEGLSTVLGLNTSTILETLVGGIFLLADPLEEKVTNYLLPHTATVTGRGCHDAYAGADITKGSFNGAESDISHINDYIKLVWDFNPSQSNGQISCVCLASEVGANIGIGNSGESNMAEKSYKECQYDTNKRILTDVSPNILLKIDETTQELTYLNYDSNTKALKIITDSLNYPQMDIFQKRNFDPGCIYCGFGNAGSKVVTVDMTGKVMSSGYCGLSYDAKNEKIYIMSNVDRVAPNGNIRMWRIALDGTLDEINVQNTSDTTLTFSSTYSTYTYYWRVDDGYLLCFDLDRKAWSVNLANNSDVGNFTFNSGEVATGLYFADAVIGDTVTSAIINSTTSSGISEVTILDLGAKRARKRRGLLSAFQSAYNGGAKTIIFEDGILIMANNAGNINIYYNPFVLATINNLDVPVEKTAAQSMRVTYTLMREGYTPPAGD